MIVYKLLVLEQGRLVSYGTLPPHELEYEPEETTRHPNMFVFDTLEHARIHNDISTAQIWEAEAPQVRPAPAQILSASGISEYFEEYWRGDYDAIPAWGLFDTPPGTLFTDELTLLRRVE